MFKVEKVVDENGQVLIQDPPIARLLFQSTAASWFWLVVRLFVGYQFLNSGWGKFTGGQWLNGTGKTP
jgi:thiosulfate dehydrogenase (quinone) large subunit